jgi:hypothetical protein
VAAAAARAGLDYIVYTDHNIWTEDQLQTGMCSA